MGDNYINNINIEYEKDKSKIKKSIDMSPIFKQAAKIKQPAPKYVDIDIEKQFMVDINILFDCMREINNYTDEQVKELVLKSMELGQPLQVPLLVDVNVGESWKES